MHSGQITVTFAGIAEEGTNEGGILFAIKGHPNNSGFIWVGNVGDDIQSSNGYPLAAGEMLLIKLHNLSDLWFDADVNGEKVCWIKVT